MNEIKTLVKENIQQLTLFGVIVVALVTILSGIMVWKLPVVSVCILVLMEAGIAVCLQNLPIWLHGLVVIAQVVMGAIFGKALFLFACAVFYIISILALDFREK